MTSHSAIVFNVFFSSKFSGNISHTHTHTHRHWLCVLLSGPQKAQPQQGGHGGPGRLQPVLHVAVAVCPVCAADAGKARPRPSAPSAAAPQLLPVSWPLFQVASLFASYVLGYLAATKMQSILVTHMVGWRMTSPSEVKLGPSCCYSRFPSSVPTHSYQNTVLISINVDFVRDFIAVVTLIP